MCGGGDKPRQDLPTIPAAVPAPISMPADVSPVQTADQRRAKISALKYGMSSTILNKGGAQGITGTGSDLVAPGAQGQKKVIGG